MDKVLRIGTRASRLARLQTDCVAARLRHMHPALEIHIESFRTQGDRDQATPAAQWPGIGFFVKELEAALLAGRIDLAVHSMKDVPTTVPDGLDVEAIVPPREDPRECLVTPAGMMLEALPRAAMVGSGSPRRRAMLLAARPDLRFVDLRGNVETRLKKLEAGAFHATVLARAGLARLGRLDRRAVVLETDVLVPPAGQGALALEFRATDERLRTVLTALDHPPSRWAVTAERALLRRLGAGCRTPLGALARVDAAGRLRIEAYLLSPTGRESLRLSAEGPATQAAPIGLALAEQLLIKGAARFLAPPIED